MKIQIILNWDTLQHLVILIKDNDINFDNNYYEQNNNNNNNKLL